MPSLRAEKHGEVAWDECKRDRRIAGIFLFAILIGILLWYWIPVPELNWVIYPDPLFPFLIGLLVAIPFTALLASALREAGRESLEPAQGSTLFSGIYRYIRHPQLLGRSVLTLVLTLWLNSLFLLIFSGLFLSIFVPTIIHFEEKDLVNRFGDSYVQYRKRTGSIFPKLRK
jgi:protein-S-isoprenylcysteine O-methyltransferase Ste14